jgi:hypothetical protein
MSVHHDVHLVDVKGYDVPVFEKDDVPHDPTNSANWPDWTDDWFWEPGPELSEPTATERAEFEAWLSQTDDYPPDDQVEDWDNIPPRRQVSPIELAMMSAGLAIG